MKQHQQQQNKKTKNFVKKREFNAILRDFASEQSG
jgi:hypothetical protein